MGMDGVELVIEIEERFGVSFPDHDLEQIATVGDLCDYLTARAVELRSRPCATAWFFYRFRRVLLEELPAPRRAVRPRATLASLIPATRRKRTWRALQHEFEHRLPALQWPTWLRRGVLGLAGLMLVAMLAGTIADGAYEYLFALPFIWALLAWIVLMLATPFATHIPAEVATVADAVRKLTGFRDLPRQYTSEMIEPWVYENVCRVVAEVLNVKPDELSRETNFIRDLGMQ